MTYGKGNGPLWGGEPLVEGDLVADIGGEFVVFDFTDEPDGPLSPDHWTFYILSTDAGGQVSVAAEPAPATFYEIVGGRARFNYAQIPLAPAPAVPFTEQGFAAGVQGVLEGRNAKLDVIFASPLTLIDEAQDEFVYEVSVGLRYSQQSFSFIGARARARWSAGVWTDPAVLEVISASGSAPSVLASDVREQGSDPVGVWDTQDTAELSLSLVGDVISASLNGILLAEITNPLSGPADVLVMVKGYNLSGAVVTPVSSLLSMRMKSLRDLDDLGPTAEIIGNLDVFETYGPPTTMLPVPDLMEKGFLKQTGARHFQFTQDVEVAVEYGSAVAFDEGDIVRSTEKYVAQTFVPVVRDLQATRARRQRS